ncbi:MAG: serine/threonine protein kinase, partial [Verrucomicrobiaceae bacterium]
GQSGGFYYLMMEFVDGVNLRQLLRTKKLTPEEALAIVPPVCEALQFAHERGIVHRDIKPENLLLDKNGRVKIADFGIAKMLGAEAVASAGEEQVAGTPEYMAPEQQITPKAADHRADIYSLGVVFYEMLTGERPAKAIEPPSRKVQIDVRLDEIVLRALEATPERRYHSAAEMRTDVETYTSEAASETGSSWGGKTESQPKQEGLLPHLGIRTTAGAVLARLSLLGFLGFLGTVPHGERLWGFSGFFGFLGAAFLVELYAKLAPQSRRALWGGVLLVSLMLLIGFVWPQRELKSEGAQTTDTWSYGAGKPWMKEINVHGPSRQRWNKFDPTAPSLVAGVLSLMFLLTVGAMQNAEREAAKTPGAALLRLREQSDKKRIRWGGVFVAGVIMMCAGVSGALLFCALMQATLGGSPSILSTALLAAPVSAAALVGALMETRADPSRVPVGKKEISPAVKLFRLTLALLIVPSVLVGVFSVVWYLSLKTPPAPHPVEVAAPGTTHSLVHIRDNEHSAFLAQDSKQLHYVLYYMGDFSSSGAGRRNGTAWTDDAGIKLKNGRSFGLRRESWNDLFLTINGQEYDLRQGRVFECKDDGLVTQLALFPEPITKESLPALGRTVREFNE